jgi:hypothetical protein
MLGVGNCITEKETRPMRTLIEAGLTTFFYDCRMRRRQRSLFGVMLVYISERKDENCKIECSTHIARGWRNV